VGFTDARTAAMYLREIDRMGYTAERALLDAATYAHGGGYARRSCLAVALAATRGLLAVVRWDLERVSGQGGER
jgi:hypothetical protein